MRIRALFAGAYGLRSHGDDAALAAFLRAARSSGHDVDAVVVSRHPEDGGYRAFGARTIRGLEYESREQAAGRWLHGFAPDDSKRHLLRLQEEIRAADVVLLGAGNWLTDDTIDLLRGPVPQFAVLSSIATMVGTPVVWFGISVGPLSTRYGCDLTRLAASMAASVTVRDPDSAAILSELAPGTPVEVLPDPVLALASETDRTPGWTAPVVAFAVRDVGDPAGARDYVARMAATADRIVQRHGTRVRFVPQCIYDRGDPQEDDRTVARAVVSRMARSGVADVVTDALDLDRTIDAYDGVSLTVATRLHGAVFSALRHVPSVSIAYRPKVRAFAEWSGQADLCVDLDACPDTIADVVDGALANRSRYVARIAQRVERGRAAVKRYVDVAIMVAHRARTGRDARPSTVRQEGAA